MIYQSPLTVSHKKATYVPQYYVDYCAFVVLHQLMCSD